MRPKGRRAGAVLRTIAVAALLVVLGGGSAWADGYRETRLRTGARLFRALLAADQGIAGKVGADGHLLILFYFDGDRAEAEALAAAAFTDAESGKPARVRGLPVRVELTDDPAFRSSREEVPAGVFLVDPLGERDLEQIIHFAIEHQVVLFSPYEGDVEKGVLGGLVIEAQVLPFVNLRTARESGITIKDFFLKVAKVTE